ncbi:unnamed protein product [Brachionus calyciflorus]|uniref:Phosphatidylinositol-glycan biosynthesis class W protein n=1 Tax=Brachionus calyciflorus TaxID=104777 RepID=A0A813TT12_9BILA|nr:unnamed protein product [Brachionus calyciflorus]
MEFLNDILRWDIIKFTILLTSFCLVCILNIFLKISFYCIQKNAQKNDLNDGKFNSMKLFCCCILAVDFQHFPYYYTKTHDYGVSLMDIGVGYFILCHSMRLIRNNDDKSNNSLKSNLKSIPLNMFKTAKKTSLLLYIGLIRLFLLSMSGYRVNVNEYGVHWNFFFTIFFVKVLSSPFDFIIRNNPRRAFFLSFIIGVAYQFMLSKKDFREYILEYDQERKSLIDKNKEGLFSTLGYMSIYFAGEAICYQLKMILKKNDEVADESSLSGSIKCCFNLLKYFLIFISMELTMVYFVQDISRRMCNLSFIFHTVSILDFVLE